MIDKFQCTNYKNITLREPLHFGRVNIFVGPNNCGKSNLIEALSFPSGVIEAGLYQQLLDAGMGAIPDRYRSDNDITFDYTLSPAGNSNREHDTLRYKMETRIDRESSDTYHIVEERLSYEHPAPGHEDDGPFNFFNCHTPTPGYGFCSFHDDHGHHTSRRIKVAERETFFRQLNAVIEELEADERNKFIDDLNPTIKTIRKRVAKWHAYSMSKISVTDLTSPAKMTESEQSLVRDGSNFQNLIRLLHDDDGIEAVEDILRTQEIIPGLNKIKTVFSSPGVTTTEFRIARKTFKLSELSDGTIRMLLLILLTQTRLRPSVLFIDEPEINIHPAWQKLVYQFLTTGTDGMQLFIATHSPDLLDRFTSSFLADDGSVKIFTFDDSGITDMAQNIDYIHDKNDQQGWEIGDLYRVGDPVIGGWPW